MSIKGVKGVPRSKGVICGLSTARHTHTKVKTEDTISAFQDFVLQPIIKDRSNMKKKNLPVLYVSYLFFFFKSISGLHLCGTLCPSRDGYPAMDIWKGTEVSKKKLQKREVGFGYQMNRNKRIVFLFSIFFVLWIGLSRIFIYIFMRWRDSLPDILNVTGTVYYFIYVMGHPATLLW